jgi:hypothetical protein
MTPIRSSGPIIRFSARIVEHGARLADRVWLGSQLLRHAAADHHVFESLDRLRAIIFEHFEIFPGEVGDGHAIRRRVHVHAHVARIASEGWLCLILQASANRRRRDQRGNERPEGRATRA